VRTRPDGDHDGRVIGGYLFNCLQLVEPVLETRDSFGAALSLKVGAGAQATRGAAPSRETGAGAVGTRGSSGAERRELEPQGNVAVPELPRARRREPEPRGHAAALELPQAGRQEPGPWDTRVCTPILSFVLT
jgi:hypothetical protein